ncbi:MAG: SCP2 sterol-binding domain-containing protein [Proteobacteria bacterium]|nr:SCP2 sterol-binding domain-containing protein [Pseudomonadota bacterium]
MNKKMIDLASRPLKFIPSWMQGAGLGLFLAHVVENNPDFRERLSDIDGKHFLFEATDVGQRFFLYIKDKAITVKVHYHETPDVTMKGEFSVLLGLMMSKVDPDTVFFSRKLEITGNTATALCFKNILDSIE